MDKKALKILFDTFWSPRGWKPEAERVPSPDDFLYAKSKGMMFDPVGLPHTQAVNELFANIKRLDRRDVADAFLASLSTRRLDWRSALGSYAVFHRLPIHAPIDSGARCNICGFYLNGSEEDLNILNFERYKWGGVRHDLVAYAWLDLKLFLSDESPKPTSEDLQIFRDILAAISAVPSDVTSAGLHAYFAKFIKSSKAERDVIVAIFGFCGILGTPKYPGFNESFVAISERTLPDRRFVDMPFPACWWHGGVGINQNRLEEYFGHAM